jgi:hypothetical protein
MPEKEAGLPDFKIIIWVNLGGSFNLLCWYILWSFGIFYDHLVYFIAIRYIFPVLVSCTNKNLATLE